MNQIHTSYKTSKMLKEFLGESAPEPMGIDAEYYDNDGRVHTRINILDMPGRNIKVPPLIPRFALHDLLSKPFCEAMAKVLAKKEYEGLHTEGFCAGLSGRIHASYYFGGVEAVEKTLTEMMGGK